MVRLILFIFISFSLSAIAQDNYAAKEISIQDIQKEISQGQQPGFKLDVYQADRKDIEKSWSKLLKKNTKSDVTHTGNEWQIIGAQIEGISKDPINVYAVINEHQSHIELSVFVESNQQFITQQNNETKYLGVKKFLVDFGTKAYKEAIENEIKAEKKELKKLEGEHDKLVNENDKLHKKISEEGREIDNANLDIETNKSDLARAKDKINNQKDRIYKIKDNAQRKEAEKELKGFKSDLSKFERTRESRYKSIDKSEAKIRDYERRIEDNEDFMSLKEQEIDHQQVHVQQIEKKFRSID